eukprot:scaffold1006_cov408-Prasinococcus_capsulatus_cf.AAC.2
MPEPRQVNKWDIAAVKRILDERACAIVLDSGYREDFYVSNVKILLGLLTCGFAIVAQFYPEKFPENVSVLMACIGGYILFNLVLQLFINYKEVDNILFTHAKDTAKFVNPGILVASRMDRFQDVYTLEIKGKAIKGKAAQRPVKLEKSVAKWFDVDGVLAENIFKADVLKLLQEYEEGFGSKQQ